jgi:hypothetical protein
MDRGCFQQGRMFLGIRDERGGPSVVCELISTAGAFGSFKCDLKHDLILLDGSGLHLDLAGLDRVEVRSLDQFIKLIVRFVSIDKNDRNAASYDQCHRLYLHEQSIGLIECPRQHWAAR